MRMIYLGDVGILCARHKTTDCAMWTHMLHVKELYFCGRKMQVGYGAKKASGEITSMASTT
jgi:hypothetical protein